MPVQKSGDHIYEDRIYLCPNTTSKVASHEEKLQSLGAAPGCQLIISQLSPGSTRSTFTGASAGSAAAQSASSVGARSHAAGDQAHRLSGSRRGSPDAAAAITPRAGACLTQQPLPAWEGEGVPRKETRLRPRAPATCAASFGSESQTSAVLFDLRVAVCLAACGRRLQHPTHTWVLVYLLPSRRPFPCSSQTGCKGGHGWSPKGFVRACLDKVGGDSW